MITSGEAHPNELCIAFKFALDPKTAADAASYTAQQWNYKWTGNYGSDPYHPEAGEVGKQDLHIAKAKVSSDGKVLTLELPKLRSVDQLY